MLDIEQRVDRGARLLDQHLPGWYERINVDALQMQNSCRCILGQLHGGNYTRGRVELGIVAGESSQYGFNASQMLYERLKDLWIKEIELRRLAATSPAYPEQKELIGV